MSQFEYLEVKIYPYFSNNRDKEIKIIVGLNGQESIGIIEILPTDHFESYFEQVFDRAKRLIMDEIKKKIEINKDHRSLAQMEKIIQEQLEKSNGEPMSVR
jgi:hypothetical protein